GGLEARGRRVVELEQRYGGTPVHDRRRIEDRVRIIGDEAGMRLRVPSAERKPVRGLRQMKVGRRAARGAVTRVGARRPELDVPVRVVRVRIGEGREEPRAVCPPGGDRSPVDAMAGRSFELVALEVWAVERRCIGAIEARNAYRIHAFAGRTVSRRT